MGQGRSQGDQSQSQEGIQVAQEDPTQQFGQSMQAQAQRIAAAQQRAMQFRNQFMGQFAPGIGQARQGMNDFRSQMQPDFLGLLAQLSNNPTQAAQIRSLLGTNQPAQRQLQPWEEHQGTG